MILESRIYKKLYEIEILIGKTIRLDEGQGKYFTGTTLACLHWKSTRQTHTMLSLGQLTEDWSSSLKTGQLTEDWAAH